VIAKGRARRMGRGVRLNGVARKLTRGDRRWRRRRTWLMVLLALACAAVLIATACLALARQAWRNRSVYGICLIVRRCW
jgi:hypothetical protein